MYSERLMSTVALRVSRPSTRFWSLYTVIASVPRRRVVSMRSSNAGSVRLMFLSADLLVSCRGRLRYCFNSLGSACCRVLFSFHVSAGSLLIVILTHAPPKTVLTHFHAQGRFWQAPIHIDVVLRAPQMQPRCFLDTTQS